MEFDDLIHITIGLITFLAFAGAKIEIIKHEAARCGEEERENE